MFFVVLLLILTNVTVIHCHVKQPLGLEPESISSIPLQWPRDIMEVASFSPTLSMTDLEISTDLMRNGHWWMGDGQPAFVRGPERLLLLTVGNRLSDGAMLLQQTAHVNLCLHSKQTERTDVSVH